ncbi:MAG TPA: UDP-N-acetylglucosamine 2-epimerase (non-hydrolyzing), partial [Dehalococcoidia bacterium]
LMSDVFFRDLGLPAPDVNLGVGSGAQGAQTARMLEGLEAAIVEQAPDWVIVFGDTNSTLAGALAAAKLQVPLAHVEAGLRSFDRSMPEEVNRVVTDHVSTLLFCPTTNAVDLLAREGITAGVYRCGDLMYDSLLAALPLVKRREVDVLGKRSLEPGAYYLATVHRQASTDSPGVLRRLFHALSSLDLPVVLPLHPRTRAAAKAASIVPGDSVHVMEPVGYVEMVALERNARAVLTDSGGVQREAYFLEVPCVTLREESEWPETLQDGWNVLAGSDPAKIAAAAKRPRPKKPPAPVFGDGRAAARIVEILERDSSDR